MHWPWLTLIICMCVVFTLDQQYYRAAVLSTAIWFTALEHDLSYSCERGLLLLKKKKRSNKSILILRLLRLCIAACFSFQSRTHPKYHPFVYYLRVCKSNKINVFIYMKVLGICFSSTFFFYCLFAFHLKRVWNFFLMYFQQPR